jgi:biopolymer transport protein ExbD
MKKTFFNKKQKNKKPPMELEITSLLDILVILLVFLLKSYNPSDYKLNLKENISLADSNRRNLGVHALTIQVDQKHQIWFENENLGTINTSETNHQLLLSKLKEQAEKTEDKEKTLNLIFDKSIDYKNIKHIMHTAALSGHNQFKFIVQGNFQ